MGKSLQIRESLQELLFTDRYDTDDTEQLIQRRFEKKPPFGTGRVIENPVFRKICSLMDLELDFDELRDLYFSAEFGQGSLFLFRFRDTDSFMALDLHRDKVGDSDAVTLAVYCDARKYVRLSELFDLLKRNCTLEGEQDMTDARLSRRCLNQTTKLYSIRAARYPWRARSLSQK